MAANTPNRQPRRGRPWPTALALADTGSHPAPISAMPVRKRTHGALRSAGRALLFATGVHLRAVEAPAPRSAGWGSSFSAVAGAADVLAGNPIRRDLQAPLAAAPAAEQPPTSTPASPVLRTIRGSAAALSAAAPDQLWKSSGPGARSASTRVAARPREREPGVLAGRRGSGRQQAHG
jgi:hypothetical protein